MIFSIGALIAKRGLTIDPGARQLIYNGKRSRHHGRLHKADPSVSIYKERERAKLIRGRRVPVANGIRLISSLNFESISI